MTFAPPVHESSGIILFIFDWMISIVNKQPGTSMVERSFQRIEAALVTDISECSLSALFFPGFLPWRSPRETNLPEEHKALQEELWFLF